MIRLSKWILAFLLISFSSMTNAQEVEMADAWQADGKIRVVIGVMVIIFIGLASILFFIDRKIGRLERKIKTKG